MNSQKEKLEQLSSLELTTPLLRGETYFSKSIPLRGFYKHPLKQGSKSPETSRSYIPGDPPKLIDWRTFARTETLIVREEAKTTRKRILILCDNSPSMHWPDENFYEVTGEKKSLSKIDLALRIALHLSYQNHSYENIISLGFLEGKRIFSTEIKSKNEVFFFEKKLKESSFQLESLIGRSFFEKHYRLPFHTFYFLSDLLNQQEVTFPFISQRKKILQTLSSYELQSEWLKKNFHYCKSLNNSPKFAGEELKKNNFFDREFQAWLQEQEKNYKKKGYNFHTLSEHTKISEYLKYVSF